MKAVTPTLSACATDAPRTLCGIWRWPLGRHGLKLLNGKHRNRTQLYTVGNGYEWSMWLYSPFRRPLTKNYWLRVFVGEPID